MEFAVQTDPLTFRHECRRARVSESNPGDGDTMARLASFSEADPASSVRCEKNRATPNTGPMVHAIVGLALLLLVTLLLTSCADWARRDSSTGTTTESSGITAASGAPSTGKTRTFDELLSPLGTAREAMWSRFLQVMDAVAKLETVAGDPEAGRALTSEAKQGLIDVGQMVTGMGDSLASVPQQGMSDDERSALKLLSDEYWKFIKAIAYMYAQMDYSNQMYSLNAVQLGQDGLLKEITRLRGEIEKAHELQWVFLDEANALAQQIARLPESIRESAMRAAVPPIDD